MALLAIARSVYEVKLKGRLAVAEGTMAFRLSKPDGFVFEADQAISLELIGPPAMVEAMQRTLGGAGIAGDSIRTEEFYGY